MVLPQQVFSLPFEEEEIKILSNDGKFLVFSANGREHKIKTPKDFYGEFYRKGATLVVVKTVNKKALFEKGWDKLQGSNYSLKEWRKDGNYSSDTTEWISIAEAKESNMGNLIFGSVVKYNDEFFVVKGFSTNGAVQLVRANGENFSGTPMPKKLELVKQLSVEEVNGVKYAYSIKSDKLFSSKGEVWKNKENEQRAKIVKAFL